MDGASNLHHNADLPVPVVDTMENPETVSNMTEQCLMSPSIRNPPLGDSDIGLPPTPQSRTLSCMQEDEEREEGYNSDGVIGPFVDSDKEEVGVNVPIKEEVGVGFRNGPSEEDGVTADDQKMKH